MFNMIRFIISCAFFGISIIVIKKSKTLRKRLWYVVSASISAMLITVLAFLPFENLFITFQSPKVAYEYFNFGQSNIELVIPGNACDFVVDCQNDSNTYLIIPKTENGCIGSKRMLWRCAGI